MDSTCSNLWANTSYCVKPVGNIETYCGYTTTTAATTFTRAVTTTNFVPSPVQTATLQPRAYGTISDCYVYENAFDVVYKLNNLSAANSCSSWHTLRTSLLSSCWSGIPASPAVIVCSKQGKATAYRNGRLLVRRLVMIFYLALRSARCVSTDGGAYSLANVVLPYDYCVPTNRTRIPASSVQPSGRSCYTNFRIQDKS